MGLNATGFHWLRNKPPRGSTIDRGHPLARGLLWGALANEMVGNTLYDITGNNNHAAWNGTGAISWGGSSWGGGLNFDGTGGNNLTTANNVPVALTSASAGSWAAWVTVSSATVGSLMTQNSSVNMELLFINSTTASFQTSSGGNQVNVTVPAVAAGSTYFFLATWNRVLATNNQKLYVNNLVSTGNDTSVSALTASPLLINARATKSNNMVFSQVLIWNRALTAAEARWLYEEPYAMVLPPVPRRWFVGSGFIWQQLTDEGVSAMPMEYYVRPEMVGY